MNLQFQNALNRVVQRCPPIWLMRQAGRYHQHYQMLKERYSFIELCKAPELAAEVAMGPIRDFDFDVAILFSDLLFPLEALGMGLEYSPGPKLSYELRPEHLLNLKNLDEAENFLRFQAQAVQLTREMLPQNKSLIGFVGGPWTLFTYATCGGHDGNLIFAKSHLSFYKQFCEIMIPLLKRNIRLQLEAGAEVVMIFDTAAGELSPQVYQQYVAPSLSELAGAFKGRLGYYSKGTQWAHMQTHFQNTDWAGHGVDHRWNLSEVLKQKTCGFTQGNFDQALLFAGESDFRNHVLEWLAPIKDLSQEQRRGWVCGLGHGVLPKTPERHVKEFVRIIRQEMSD